MSTGGDCRNRCADARVLKIQSDSARTAATLLTPNTRLMTISLGLHLLRGWMNKYYSSSAGLRFATCDALVEIDASGQSRDAAIEQP